MVAKTRVQNKGTVCQKCGEVTHLDGNTEKTWGIGEWVRKGYKVIICVNCEKSVIDTNEKFWESN